MAEKHNMRRDARRIRAKAAAEAPPDSTSYLTSFFMEGPLAVWNEDRMPIVAGYWPFGTEIDTRPLLHKLVEKGYEVALPVTDAVRPALLFRKWDPAEKLVPDALGIKAPPPHAALLAPDIVMAAALAFDFNGHRLGYGTGYYDATLRSIRSMRKIVAVTMAFAAQQVPFIFVEPQDEKVDWIVTERYARRIEN